MNVHADEVKLDIYSLHVAGIYLQLHLEMMIESGIGD